MWQSPVLKALDANNDHIISQQGLKEATSSLLKLDKNSDGVLTSRELIPVFESGSKDTIHDGASRGEVVAERTEISGCPTREILKLLGSIGMLEPGKDELKTIASYFLSPKKIKIVGIPQSNMSTTGATSLLRQELVFLKCLTLI